MESWCVCLCPSLRALIAIHMKAKSTGNNQLNQFHGFSVLYMTITINKVDGRGLSNKSCCEHNKIDALIATEGGI